MSKPRATANQFAEFFRWHAILPTTLHEDLQGAAMQEGWIPPWDRDDQAAQKKVAGKRSAALRRGLALIRRYLVTEAHRRLKPAYRLHPFSTDSIDALHKEYLHLLAPDTKDLGVLVPLMLGVLSENDRKNLSKVKRDTLLNDLKVLGIRSKRQKQRSG